jgi:hypothetical protein
VPVSGRTLVGLLSVSSTQPPDGVGLLPGNIAVPAALASDGNPVCVRATTQDGRYSAENTFASNGNSPKHGRADLDWPTAYGETLRNFPLQEVAAVARRGTCAAEAEIIPVMLGVSSGLGTLQVLVNTRGAAITAVLRDPETGRTLRRANCTRVTGAARVAFDDRCVLGTAEDLPSRVQIRIEQVSHDGLQTEVIENLILRLAD